MTSATTLLDVVFKDTLTTPDFSLEFDATRTITYSGVTEPTEHTVEDGAEVTDHSINKPDEVELGGLVSNSPIVWLGTARATPSVTGGSPRTRAQDAYDAIVAARKSATLVQLSTEWREFEDMQIISESVTRDRGTGDILDITVRLKQFQRATVETAVNLTDPKDLVDKSDSKRGRQQLEEPEPEVAAKSDSLLAGFAEAF